MMKKTKKYLFVLGALLLVVLLACEKEELLMKRTPVVSKQEAQAFLKKYQNDFFTAAISKLRYEMMKLPKHKDSMCFAVLPARVQPKQDAAVLFLAKRAGKVEAHIISAGVAKDPIFDLKKGFSGMLFHWTVDGRLLGKQYFIHHQEVTSEEEVHKFAQYHHELAGSHHKGKEESLALGYYYGGGNPGWCYYCNTRSFTNGCTHNTIDEVTVRAVRGVSIPFYLSPAIHMLYMGNVTLNFSNFANRMGYGIGGGRGRSSNNNNNGGNSNANKIITKKLGKKTQCIYDRLRRAGGGFDTMVKGFDPVMSLYDLEYKEGKLDPGKNGKTLWYGPNSRKITIILNSSQLGRSNIAIARTIIHESIHAEMYRVLKMNGKNYDSNGRKLYMTAPFKVVFNKYAEFKKLYSKTGEKVKGSINAWHHEQMAKHYVRHIATILRAFEPGHSDEDYELMAWGGLTETDVFRSKKISERLKIKRAVTFYKEYKPNESCKN